MTEIYNGKPVNQTPVPGMTAERIKRAMAIIEAREQQAQRDVEVIEQLLQQGQVEGATYENKKPTMPVYNPTYPVESVAPVRPNVQPVIRRDLTVDGVPRHLSADMNNSAREAYIASKQATGSVVDYEYVHPSQDYTTFSGEDQQKLRDILVREENSAHRPDTAPKPKATLNPNYPPDHVINRHIMETQGEHQDENATALDKKSKRRFTKKQLGVGAVLLAGVVASGTGVAVVSGAIGGNGSHDAAVIDNNANENINPELIPVLTTAPLVEAFGGCMDENGGGSVLGSGSVKSEVTTSWMMGMKGANGGELKAEFGEGAIVYPKVQLESDLDYTACVVAANVANVVTLDVTDPAKPKAKVSLDLVDSQLRGKVDEDITKLKRGWSSSDFTPKLIKVEDLMKDGVEQKAIPADVATNFTAAYNDVPNAAAEVQSAEKITVDTIAAEGSVYSEQLKTTITQKIESSIKAKVQQLAQDNLTKAKTIEVSFTGKLKALLVKNSPAPKADKFTVPMPKAVLKDFTPLSPQVTEEAK
jgi:hypothetical protein